MKKAITFRAVLIAILLMPLNSWWVAYMEVITYTGHPTTMSLFFNVVFTLLFLILINYLLKRFAPRYMFTQGELMVIYTILALSSCMVGHDMYQVLIACLTHPFWFATPENKWKSLFFKYLPKWLMVSDKNILEGYFMGWSSFYTKEHILAWLPVILIWTGFFMVLIFLMMCINVIFRKQWTERERLTFPIILLPLAMTDENFTLFKQRLMWIGFAIASLVDIINNINANFPAVPHIPIRDYDLGQYITNPPWNAIGWTPLALFPCIIGLGFLLPVDLSFSCWFFYWYWKFQRIVSVAFNLNVGRPDMPYINDQSAGAYIGVTFFVIWVARHYLKEVFKKALGMKSELDDSDEPMSYRTAIIGILIGFPLAAYLFVRAGMSWGISLIALGIFFILSIAVARMRAELGSPAHDLHFAGPDQMITRIWGVENISPKNLTVLSLYWGFNRAYRSHPMPHQIEGFKIAERLEINPRKFMWIMFLASFIGSFVAFWALLDLYYRIGAASAKVVGPATWFGWEPYNRLSSWIETPAKRDDLCSVFTGVGFAVCLFLIFMKTTFFWWPFHPVGYAVSSSWSMSWMWFPIFIGWLAKFIILKSTGLKGYRTALPFFFGLILGEFTVGSLANILGILFDWRIYHFWG
jgi:hypothetical protein